MDLGYVEVQSLDSDYRALGATGYVENGNECRLDIFNQQVANNLVLIDGIHCQIIAPGPVRAARVEGGASLPGLISD